MTSVCLLAWPGFLDGEEVRPTGAPSSSSAASSSSSPDRLLAPHHHATESSSVGLSMRAADFSYGANNNTTAAVNASSSSESSSAVGGRLLNCSLEVGPGELVAVVGSLGSGKSSLVRQAVSQGGGGMSDRQTDRQTTVLQPPSQPCSLLRHRPTDRHTSR